MCTSPLTWCSWLWFPLLLSLSCDRKVTRNGLLPIASVVGSKPKKKKKDIEVTKETENLKNMKEILKRIESNKLLLSVQNDLFENEAILNASYKFTNKCYINIELNGSLTEIYFRCKDENNDLELIALNFNNELLDQQVRLNTGREFKSIREELVRKAFSTVTKKE